MFSPPVRRVEGPSHYALAVARYFDVHPDNPQPRSVAAVVELLRDDALVAYPTDSCFALGCQLGNREGLERIRAIRALDDRHQFTLVCAAFSQLGQFVHLDNHVFRADQGRDPGPVHLHPAGDPRGAPADAAPQAPHGRRPDS